MSYDKKIKDYFQTYHRNRLIAALIALCLLGFAGFMILYVHAHSTMRAVDASAWGANTGEYLCGVDEVTTHHIEYIYYPDYVKITGWALKQGESIEVVNTTFVLQDTATGVLYELPTSYMTREDVNSSIEDEFDYTSCGLESVIRTSELASTYLICMHYCNDGNDVFINTGRYIVGGDYITLQ